VFSYQTQKAFPKIQILPVNSSLKIFFHFRVFPLPFHFLSTYSSFTFSGFKMADLSKAVAIYGFRPPSPRQIECAGISYECYLVLHRLQLGLCGGVVAGDAEGLSKSSSNSSDDLNNENPEDFMDMDEAAYFRHVSKLDPNDYKTQDHYRVLGLSTLRFQATMGQIKTACKWHSVKL
jgi:hypothetical protein